MGKPPGEQLNYYFKERKMREGKRPEPLFIQEIQEGARSYQQARGLQAP